MHWRSSIPLLIAVADGLQVTDDHLYATRHYICIPFSTSNINTNFNNKNARTKFILNSITFYNYKPWIVRWFNKWKKKPLTHIVSWKIDENSLESCIKHFELIDDNKS